MSGVTVMQCLALSPLSGIARGLNPPTGRAFLCMFPVCLWVPPTVQRHPCSVNWCDCRCEWECELLSVSLDWQPAQGVPYLWCYTAVIGSSCPATLKLDEQLRRW